MYYFFNIKTVLKLKSHTTVRPLTFTRPLMTLACNSVQMFLRFWPT